ncbi:MAG: fasciclin domain-containing protein [Planctomycetes bacterium]|nr:fasciclin domain-containing protein [Planctomycetota bacterium]
MQLRCAGLMAAALCFSTPATAQDTIADLVVAASGGAAAGTFDQNGNDYDLLLTALNTAGLTAAVADPAADLTVFAPRDAAFVRLARDLGYQGQDEQGSWTFLVQALTTLGGGDPVPVLQDVLKYHVAPARITLFGVLVRSLFGIPIPTLVPGATIQPAFTRLIDNEPDLGDPRVRLPLNLFATNGVVHTIDRVLLPIDLP